MMTTRHSTWNASKGTSSTSLTGVKDMEWYFIGAGAVAAGALVTYWLRRSNAPRCRTCGKRMRWEARTVTRDEWRREPGYETAEWVCPDGHDQG